jgi:hypothetical protein
VCFRISSRDAQILAPELSLQRRNHLTVELTQLTRGEAIGRFGSYLLRRFRVGALPHVPSITPERFDQLIAPVTRDRQAIEATRQAAMRPVTIADTTASVEEGQDAW